MGMISFQNSTISSSAKEGYERLCNEARDYYGHQEGYSGAINSTDGLGRCYFKEKFNKTNEKKAQEIIDKELPKMYKRQCGYIVLEGVKWEITTIKKKNKKNNPKYQFKYNVYSDRLGFLDSSPIASVDTKSEAWEKAIKHSLKTGEECFIRKEQTLVKGSSLVGEVVIERKTYKTKPKRKLKTNQKLIKYNKYIYFGWAAD